MRTSSHTVKLALVTAPLMVGALGVGMAAGTSPAQVVALLAVVVVVALAAASSRRIAVVVGDSTPSWSAAPELLVLPTVVSLRQSQAAILVLLAACVFVAWLRTRHAARAHVAALPLFLLLGAYAVTVRTDRLSDLLLTALVGLVVVVAARGTTSTVGLWTLWRGLGVYLLANVAGWAVGLQARSATERVAGLDTSSTLFATRVFFPFARSLAEPPIVAAGFLAGFVAVLLVRRRAHLIEWASLAAGAFVLLGANSRTPLIVTVLVIFGVLAGQRALRAVALPAALLMLSLPFYLAAVTDFLQQLGAAFASYSLLARDQSADQLAGLGSRGDIWSASVEYWTDTVGVGRKILGYGAQGQVGSGVYRTYAAKIASFVASPELLTVHNSLLEQLFDGGVLGLGLLVAGLAVVMWRLRQRPETLPLLAVVTAVALSSATEVTLSPAVGATPFLVLVAIAGFAATSRSASIPAPTAVRQPEDVVDDPTVPDSDPEHRVVGAARGAGRHSPQSARQRVPHGS